MVSVVSTVTPVGGVGGRVVRVRVRLLGGQLTQQQVWLPT